MSAPTPIQAPDDYYDFLKRLDDRKNDISQRITNIKDPLQAIEGLVESEGSTVKSIWESDSGYPIDGAMFMIVMIPVALGIIGHYIALRWEPTPTGEELYDDFGNRIVEYPKMPIAYLQQTRKDLSATRENRNSLAWLCHRWLISTNDVVQELQAPYPLEQSTLRTVPEKTGKGKRIAKMYEKLQKAALEWRTQLKKLKKDDFRRKLESRKRAKPLHTLPFKLVFRKAANSDVLYIKRRILKARRLWNKLNKWLEEYSNRGAKEKSQPEDINDSYWSSSETFSSDSGEHWKSYKGDAVRWAKAMKTTAQWKLEKGKRMHEAAEEARKRREAEEARKKKKAEEEAAAAAEADGNMSKSGKESSAEQQKQSRKSIRIGSTDIRGSNSKSRTSLTKQAGSSKNQKSTDKMKTQVSEASKAIRTKLATLKKNK